MPNPIQTQPQDASQDPIFLLGMAERTGTNFLFHLLCMHPGCDYGGPIWENYVTPHLEFLSRFARAVYTDYAPEWDVASKVGDEDVLLADLGRGLIHYINRQRANGKTTDDLASSPGHEPKAPSSRRLVTKTPSVKNLPLFQQVFPSAKLIILVRDGRSVVESQVRSFGGRYEDSMHNWVTAARTVNDFIDAQTGREMPGHLVVRYEDLATETERTLREVFAYLDLDAGLYDFMAARKAPVIGSSETKSSGAVHWDHVDRPKDFDPMRRWAHWSPALQDRFAHLAGVESERLGYPIDNGPGHQLGNALQDLAWRLRRAR